MAISDRIKKALPKIAAMKKTPIQDTVSTVTKVVPMGDDTDAIDSTYLKERRSTLGLGRGGDVKNTKGEVIGRSFRGIGPHEGRSFIVRKDSDEIEERTPQGRKISKLEDFKSEARANLKEYAASSLKRGLSDMKKIESEKELRKPMSDENVSKLAAALKAKKP